MNSGASGTTWVCPGATMVAARRVWKYSVGWPARVRVEQCGQWTRVDRWYSVPSSAISACHPARSARAIQRDQRARAQALEGREPARALQVTDHLVEPGKQVIGRDRVEHAADVAVTGDAAHPEQGVCVGAAVPGRKLALVGQK